MKIKSAIYKIAHLCSMLVFLFITLTTTTAVAASVKLAWDPSGSTPDGYRVFCRRGDQVYNYNNPDWQGTSLSCTVNNLEDQTEYYIVVRAFDGGIESANSNEVHYIPPNPSNPDPGGLDPRFDETTLTEGVEYYTDRSYQLTGVPSAYDGMEAIITPNDDRNRTNASGYLTATMPYAATVYVAYDSRATSLPYWLNGFVDTGDIIQTSLSSQPSLKIFSRKYNKGEVVNLGANKAPGFAGGVVSNFVVFYGNAGGGSVGCALASKFDESTMDVGVYSYTDRDYSITGGVPDWMKGRMLIQTPNDERKSSAGTGYLSFTNPVSWWVYVLFDSRSSSIPNWLSGWERRSQYRIETSLGSQPYLKVYRKMFSAGQCVNLGGNYGPGSSGENRSNYMVVYGK